jgi:HK97 family phage major capsid protein
MSKLKELFEKRAALQTEFKELDGIATRSAEQNERFDKIFDESDRLSAEIATEERALQMRAELADKQDQRDNRPVEERQMEHFRNLMKDRRSAEFVEDPKMRTKEGRAAIQTVTTTGGGNTIPVMLMDAIEVAEKYYLPFSAELFNYITTSGGYDIPIPAVNDTANEGYQININTSAETSATAVAFNQPNTLKAFKFTSGMIQIPTELIEDSIVNITQFIADRLGERMGRAKSNAFTTGAGTTAPMGLSTIIKATAALQVAPASNTAISGDDIINLMFSLDPAYASKPQTRWMLNNLMLRNIARLTVGATDDRPLWQQGLAQGMPNTILGVPYLLNNYMDSTTALNKLSLIYGDMKAYWIRQVADRRVNIVRERYAEFDQIGVVMWERLDGQLVDAGTHPIKGLYHNLT